MFLATLRHNIFGDRQTTVGLFGHLSSSAWEYPDNNKGQHKATVVLVRH